MSYEVIRSCEWCGVEHNLARRKIVGHSGGTNCDFKVDDLCDTCYKRFGLALKNRHDIITHKIISVNMWVISVLVAAGIGAFISAIISMRW